MWGKGRENEPNTIWNHRVIDYQVARDLKITWNKLSGQLLMKKFVLGVTAG